MYVDIHIHMQPLDQDGLGVTEVNQWMAAHGVEKVAVQWGLQLSDDEQEQSLYKRAVRLYAQNRGWLFPFGYVAPEMIGSRQSAREAVARLKRDGAVGFGEHKPFGLAIDDSRSVWLYEACAAEGLPVLLHLDRRHNTDEPGLPRLEALLKAYPDCIFIGHANTWWAHISGDVQESEFGGYPKRPVAPGGVVGRLLRGYPNLYGDLSANSGANAISRDTKFGRDFLIRHADKLLFGTDTVRRDNELPHFDLFESLALPSEVKAKIYRDNALRILPGMQGVTGK